VTEDGYLDSVADLLHQLETSDRPLPSNYETLSRNYLHYRWRKDNGATELEQRARARPGWEKTIRRKQCPLV
jgi:hypothetical protein